MKFITILSIYPFFVNRSVENGNYPFPWRKHEIHSLYFRKNQFLCSDVIFFNTSMPPPAGKKLINHQIFKGPSVQSK